MSEIRSWRLWKALGVAKKEDPIKVWPFRDAPEDLQQCSDNGGDEDWLAWVPKRYQEEYISWLQVGAFGVCDVNVYTHPAGTIYIGVHA